MTPVHEVGGEVDQPGHALQGQRILASIPVWSGACRPSAADDTNLCDNATQLVEWQRDGGDASS